MSRARAKTEEFRYNGLTPREFGERVSLSDDAVRAMIDAGWFGWNDELKVPECMDVGSGQRPEYRIHESAVPRFYQERMVRGKVA